MRISDWSSDVCSSDLRGAVADPYRRLRSHEGEWIAGDHIAIACELHAQGRDRAEAVVHRHRSRSGRENGKGAIGVGGVDDAVDVRPVVVTGAVLPDAVTAIDRADRKSTRLNSSH